MSTPNRALYGIDAGGSSTSVRTWNGERWTLPPVNPSSTGHDASGRCLTDVFDRIQAHAGRYGTSPGSSPTIPAVWLASASVAPATATEEVGRCGAAARAVGLRAELVLSNDVTPLLLGAPPNVGHIIAVCGTGSGFLATDGRSTPVRVGGCEYLGSDEGSAFDLGLNGLRAAVRGLDGRGPRTTLSEMFKAEAGVPVLELARRLAGTPFPKPAVAAYAPVVLNAWLDGDPVSADLVDAAVDELTVGVRAARDAAGIAPAWHLSVTGGVMTGCEKFFDKFAEAAEGIGAHSVALISDATAAVLAALASLACTDLAALSDARIRSDTWYVDLDERTGDCGEALPLGTSDRGTRLRGRDDNTHRTHRGTDPHG